MPSVKGGATDQSFYFVLRTAADNTATTGATITNIDLQYVRTGVAPSAKADATALAATDSVHADNQAIEIDATDAPGLYRVDWPDAAFAAGVPGVVLTVKLASSFTAHMYVEIDPPVNVTSISDDQAAADNLESACDNYSATRGLAGTALPAAAADAAGGVPISDAGELDLDAQLANTHEVTAARMGALTDWLNGERLDLLLDAILADTGTDGVLLAPGAIAAASFGAGAINAAAIAANAITAPKIATDAITAAKIAADAIGASELAASAANEIRDAVFAKTGLTAGGSVSFATISKLVYSFTRGKVVIDGSDWKFYDDDNSTLLFTLTVGAGGRTVA